MKQYTMYVCDTCGYESKNAEEVKEHEAAHMNLTTEEAKQYKILKSYAAYMGSVVSRIKNEETEQKFDEAIQNLLDFEKEHGINIDSSCSCS